MFTCQKDDFETVKQNYSKDYPNIHSQILSLDEAQQNSKLQKSLKKISHSFDVNKPKTKNKTSNSTLETNLRIDSNDGSFSILTDEILHVTSNGGEAWSFKIETPLLTEATFENFVIIDNGENIEFNVYSYITLEYHGEQRHFLISILPIEEGIIDTIDFQDIINAKMHLIDGCLYNIPEDDGDFEVIWCNDGASGTGPTGGGATTTSGGGEWVYHVINGKCIRQKIVKEGEHYILITEYNVTCPPGVGNSGDGSNGNTDPSNGNDGNWDDWDLEDGHFPDNTNLGGSSGGGVGSTSGGQPAVGALPSIDQVEKTDKEKVLECLNEENLTPEQLLWLNNTANEVTIKRMATMIKKAGCDAMINIILDYIDASPPITQDFFDYADEKLECYEVEELLTANNNLLKNAVENLESELDQIDEYGYEINLNNTPSTLIQGFGYGIKLNHGGNIIGGMHTHPRGDLMFSGEDIYNLYMYYHSLSAIGNPNNTSPHDVFSVMVSSNGTYMIKIRDFTLLKFIFGGVLGNTAIKSQKYLHYKIFKNINQNSDEDDYLKEFLEAFEEIKENNNMPKTPLYLYKLNESNQVFEKVKLNSNNNPITLPCD